MQTVTEALEALRFEIAQEQSAAIWAEVVKMLQCETSIAELAPGVVKALEEFERKTRSDERHLVLLEAAKTLGTALQLGQLQHPNDIVVKLIALETI